MNIQALPGRVLFQDEARFGRLSDSRRCWAPRPLRPQVGLALVREYTYAFGAVSPADGKLDWMLTGKSDTLNMNAFLLHVRQQHPDEFLVMVLDGAPSHRAADLCIPDNMALLRLPPYSPELNSAEMLWDHLREKEFANRVFDSLGAAIAQAAKGLVALGQDSNMLRKMTKRDWFYRST